LGSRAGPASTSHFGVTGGDTGTFSQAQQQKSERRARSTCASIGATKEEPQSTSQYCKLYAPDAAAVVFIDHQPQMTFGVASIGRAALINNVTLLAKVANEYRVPTVLTAVERRSMNSGG
jgi:hypothetical protein